MKGHGQYEAPTAASALLSAQGFLFSASTDISYSMNTEHACIKLDGSEGQAAAKGHAYKSSPASSEAAADDHVVPSRS